MYKNDDIIDFLNNSNELDKNVNFNDICDFLKKKKNNAYVPRASRACIAKLQKCLTLNF